MDAPNERVIDLIRKCLALGKSPNEHEAALAMEKAQELLEKYNLSMRDIEGEAQTKISNMLNFSISIGTSEWKRYLIHYVAEANFCKILISGKDIHILGRDTNVTAVLVMSSWIVSQLESMAWFETHTSSTSSKLRWRNSFLQGAIDRIRERLQEGRKQRTSVDPNLKALVVDLSREVENYFRQEYPSIGTHYRGQSYVDSEAYKKGRNAGDRVSLYGSNKQVENRGHLLT